MRFNGFLAKLSSTMDKPSKNPSLLSRYPLQLDAKHPTCVRISSYINNLHPVKHQPLYSVIEKLIDCAIPLWNITLDTLRFGKDPHIPPIEGPEYLIDRHSIPEDMFPPSPPYTYGVDEWDQDYYDRKEAWWEANRKLVYPEPNDFENEDHTLAEDLKKEYAEDGIQVIVKLANIHLTPEKPSYDGGSWHVEGQMVS